MWVKKNNNNLHHLATLTPWFAHSALSYLIDACQYPFRERERERAVITFTKT